MSPKDMEGIRARGRAARQAGEDHSSNPFTRSPGDLDEVLPLALAWWAGWEAEDAGRSPHVYRAVQAEMMQARCWAAP